MFDPRMTEDLEMMGMAINTQITDAIREHYENEAEQEAGAEFFEIRDALVTTEFGDLMDEEYDEAEQAEFLRLISFYEE